MSRRLANVSVALAAVLVSLLAAEGFLRLFLPQQLIVFNRREIWRPDEELGWRLNPNIDTLVNTGEGEVRLITDAVGSRVGAPGPQLPSPPAGFRILAVGDSFVEGLSLQYESTLPHRLEVDAGRLRGTRVAVSSRAASGWNPHQYLLAARRELQDHTYDFGLIFLYAANDIVSADSSVTGTPARPGGSFPLNLLRPANDSLERRSHVFVLVKARSAVVLARVGLTAAYFPEIFRKTFASSSDWDSTVKVCRQIQTEFRRRDTPVAFVLLPAAYQVQPEIFESYLAAFRVERNSVELEQPNRILHRAFAEASMTLIDPLEAMRAEASHGVSLFGRIDRHLNASGSAVVSRFVAQQITSTFRYGAEPAGTSAPRGARP